MQLVLLKHVSRGLVSVGGHVKMELSVFCLPAGPSSCFWSFRPRYWHHGRI